MFGLGLAAVQRAVEKLPGVERCERYCWPDEQERPPRPELVRAGGHVWAGGRGVVRAGGMAACFQRSTSPGPCEASSWQPQCCPCSCPGVAPATPLLPPPAPPLLGPWRRLAWHRRWRCVCWSPGCCSLCGRLEKTGYTVLIPLPVPICYPLPLLLPRPLPPGATSAAPADSRRAAALPGSGASSDPTPAAP